MTDSSPGYAHKCLADARRAIGGGRDVRTGLEEAFIQISPVQPRDFPRDDLRDQFVEIKKALTAGEGTASDTIHAMSKAEAQRVAELIRDLDAKMAAEISQPDEASGEQ